MTDQRDMFKKALLQAMSEKYEDELSAVDSEINAVCSKKHYLKLSNIFGFNVRCGKRFSKRLLIGILVAALLLTGCSAYVYRDEIKGFFIEVYEKNIRGTYDTDSKSTMGDNIIKPYQASYIPEGYELVKQTQNPLLVHYEWHDENGNIITMQQSILDGNYFYIDAENGYSKVEKFEPYDVYVKQFNNSCLYVWSDGNYVLQLHSSIELSNDELFKIIKGIK